MGEERFYFRDPRAPSPNVPLTPGVAAVVFDPQRRILILKRSSGPYWSLPGGRMEVGESAAGCCLRELREETGLAAEIVRLIGIYTDPTSICAYPDGNVHQSYVVLFECRATGSGLSTSAESERFHWLDREDIGRYILMPDSVLACQDAWAMQVAAFIR